MLIHCCPFLPGYCYILYFIFIWPPAGIKLCTGIFPFSSSHMYGFINASLTEGFPVRCVCPVVWPYPNVDGMLHNNGSTELKIIRYPGIWIWGICLLYSHPEHWHKHILGFLLSKPKAWFICRTSTNNRWWRTPVLSTAENVQPKKQVIKMKHNDKEEFVLVLNYAPFLRLVILL